MKKLRTLSTARLITLIVAVSVVLVGGAVAAAVARGGSGATPPAEPLAQAIHDGLAAAKPAGITADISFTNNLFPSGALIGQNGSALMSGASGRLWAGSSGGRIELQSSSGDVQLTWNDAKATLYDASSNTAYTFDLPQSSSTGTSTSSAVPSLDQIQTFLTDLAEALDDLGCTARPTSQVRRPTRSTSHRATTAACSARRSSRGTRSTACRSRSRSTPRAPRRPRSPSRRRTSHSAPSTLPTIDITPPAGTKIVDLSSHDAGGRHR